MVLLLGKGMGFTLTLPGIAGLIVAIGITADSFIVFFERIRDEVRDGKSLRLAVEAGWVRARSTILAADAVSILAALTLFIFAIGVVRGFAFALGLTTLIDVFVVFLFTKPLVSLLARTKFFGQGHKLSGLDAAHLGIKGRKVSEIARSTEARTTGEVNLMGRISTFGQHLYEGRISFDFVGRRKLWYSISAIIVIVATSAFVLRGFNYGVEFKGGVEFTATVKTANAATSDDMAKAVQDSGVSDAGDPTVQTSGSKQIRVQTRALLAGPGDDRQGFHGQGRCHRGQPEPDRTDVRQAGRQQGAQRPDRLPDHRRAVHLGVLP